MKRLTSLLVISIALVIFLAVVGLRTIINATVFINDLVRGNTSEEETNENAEDFFGTLEMDEPPVATNSAQLIVSGAASDFDQVEYFINNVSVKKERIPSNDQFTEEIGKLKSGENKIYVVAKTKDGKHSKESDSYTVIYKSEKPKLEIETPKDGDKTNKNEMTVKGKTDKDVEIDVNNSHVVVDFEGNFTHTYRLKEGENKIEIRATDIAGNEEKKEITVRYERED